MHPVLTSRGRLVLYVVLWAALGALLATLLDEKGVSWSEAAAVALPLGVALGFVCLATFYLCHAVPLRLGEWARIIGTHGGAAGLSASIWLIAGRGWIALLATGGLTAALTDAYYRALPALWIVGVLAFLLSSAIHYSLGAVETSRHAEKRALEFELASRDAELKTLRAQIHPHFLFNSLNSINALIASEPEGARRLCVLLADFLRGSLTMGGRATVRLEEELQMAEKLLAIEKVRFGSRLAFEVKVEEAARAWLVPPLILQPLVENAITHGLAHLIEGGAVAIEGHLHEGLLHLAVSNPKDPDARRRKGTGLGLENVRRRLAALYGDSGHVVVRDSPHAFRVELTIPPAA
jgi:two-component system, LytTR family, sensor histidine kinase AlgZ